MSTLLSWYTEYEESLKIYRDNQNVLDYAIEKGWMEGREKGMAEGIAEGKAKGIAEGKAEGIAEGMAEGIAEGIAKSQRLIATNMKKSGIDTDLIIRFTGLSQEEIAAL